MTLSKEFIEEIKYLQEEIAKAKGEMAYLKSKHPFCCPSKQPKNQYLYFIQCNDTIKIGRSKDPEERLQILQTGTPFKLKLLTKIKNSGDKETYCHKKLSHLRLNGEWFWYTYEIDKLIKEIQNEND